MKKTALGARLQQLVLVEKQHDHKLVTMLAKQHYSLETPEFLMLECNSDSKSEY